ncbi:helix-turn-helix transcriptional regulator [Rhizorhabdus dicambivorans]|uniref:DNA-binding protein n=1 Tax=Rhizorhabdus dicambivorans TaxID=1850238 RepID=A0A2A4FR62_9SPHN|nr:helix-turn-helix domain-containing protein [Rhizorhabdus dicambivorans]ATE65159.1 DNA-binding protein [Rhizorhabdus dicambivorans]PCE39891.1 DNA-binding protein [Rhizorhabdus dicambivorans]
MSDDDIARAERARHSHPFLNTAQAAHYLGLSTRLLERMRSRGEGPPFRRHSRFVRYHVDDLIAWSEATRPERGRD